jgi:hypothetical protein
MKTLITECAVRTSAGFRKLLVNCELGLQKLLHKATGGLQLARHDSENTFSLISGLSKGFSHSELAFWYPVKAPFVGF